MKKLENIIVSQLAKSVLDIFDVYGFKPSFDYLTAKQCGEKCDLLIHRICMDLDNVAYPPAVRVLSAALDLVVRLRIEFYDLTLPVGDAIQL